MSEFVEDRIAIFFGNGGSKDDDKAYKELSKEELKEAARYFTF